jgi:hypothetical protein
MKTPVNIEITKGVGAISNYRGLISSEDLACILAGNINKPFVKLEEVYWVDQVWVAEGKHLEHRIVRLGITPPYEHHQSTLWIRPEHIAAILLMETLGVVPETISGPLASEQGIGR